jgi:hypothetical protein
MWLPVCRVISDPSGRKALARPEPDRSLGNFILPIGAGQRSAGDDFFPDEVKANDLGRFSLLEVTASGVAHCQAQLFHYLGLGEDGFTQRSGDETAIGGVLY